MLYAPDLAHKKFITTLNTSPTARKKTVVVLGCARGGTSATAGFLRELGVVFPTDTHPLKHEWSPVSYVGDVVDTHATRLAVEKMNESGLSWGWKSPRDIWSLSSWIGLIDNPHFVVVFRNPLHTMRSASYWDSVALKLVADSTGQVMAALGNFLAYTPFPVALISYGELRLHAEAHAEELLLWLDLKHDNAMVRNAVGFVSGDQQGYRSLASEIGIVSDSRTTEELSFVKAMIQVELYKNSNEELERRIAALTTDTEKARSLVTHMSKKVARLSREQFLANGSCADPVELEQGATALLDDIVCKSKAVRQSEHRELEGEPDHPPLELEAERARSEAAYLSLWDAFSAILRERITLQGRIEHLTWQENCLLEAALSPTGSTPDATPDTDA